MNLLILDENDQEREALLRCLMDAGFLASHTADLEKATSWLKDKRFDALVLRPPARELAFRRLLQAAQRSNPASRLFLLAPAAEPVSGAVLLTEADSVGRANEIASAFGMSVPDPLPFTVTAPLFHRGSWSSGVVEQRPDGAVVATQLEHALDDEGIDVLRTRVGLWKTRHPGLAAAREVQLTHRRGGFVLWSLPPGAPLSATPRERWTAEEIIALGQQLAAALAALHADGFRHGFVHRDAIWCAESQAVLLHAGIGELGESIRAGTRGNHFAVVISRPELAPEAVRGQPLTAALDLYGLGVVLFELLCGRGPFSGSDDFHAYEQIVKEPPPDPRTLAAVPDALAELVLDILAKDPEARPDARATQQRLAAMSSRPGPGDDGFLGKLRGWLRRRP